MYSATRPIPNPEGNFAPRKRAFFQSDGASSTDLGSTKQPFPSHCALKVPENMARSNIIVDLKDKIVKINADQLQTKEAAEETKKLLITMEALLETIARVEGEVKIHEGWVDHGSKEEKKARKGALSDAKKELKTATATYTKTLKQKDKLKGGHKITVIGDNRDGRNNDIFKYLDLLSPGIFVRANLKVLDFIILLDDKFAYGFERKRIYDAVGSTQSSHYAAQNCNMKHLLSMHIGENRSRIINILEKDRLQTEQKCACPAPTKLNAEKILETLNQATFDLVSLTGCPPEKEKQVEALLVAVNDLYKENGVRVSGTCKDDLLWAVSEEDAFEYSSFDRNRILGIPINRMLDEGFGSFVTESDVYTCYFLIKMMASILKKADELSIKWSAQPDFDMNQMQEAENKLQGEALKEWLDTRELPKESTAFPAIKSESFTLQLSQRPWALQLLVLNQLTIDYACLMVERWASPAAFAAFMNGEDAQAVVDELAELLPAGKERKFGYARAIKLYNHFFGVSWSVNKKGEIIKNEGGDAPGDLDLDEKAPRYDE